MTISHRVRVWHLSQILGFLYLGLLQLPGLVCIMVWGSILCVLLILIAMGAGFVALCKIDRLIPVVQEFRTTLRSRSRSSRSSSSEECCTFSAHD